MLPLLPDRSDRLAIKNFDFETAKAFALEVAAQQQLAATNLDSVLDSMIKSIEGNSGAILRLIAMAKQAKYHSDDPIKQDFESALSSAFESSSRSYSRILHSGVLATAAGAFRALCSRIR